MNARSDTPALDFASSPRNGASGALRGPSHVAQRSKISLNEEHLDYYDRGGSAAYGEVSGGFGGLSDGYNIADDNLGLDEMDLGLDLGIEDHQSHRRRQEGRKSSSAGYDRINGGIGSSSAGGMLTNDDGWDFEFGGGEQMDLGLDWGDDQ